MKIKYLLTRSKVPKVVRACTIRLLNLGPGMEEPMIEINGVNKKFSNTDALNNVIAAVQEKSIFGLVGTNGAGKSTLLRIMCGVICRIPAASWWTEKTYTKIRKSKGGSAFSPTEAYFFPNCHRGKHGRILRDPLSPF